MEKKNPTWQLHDEPCSEEEWHKISYSVIKPGMKKGYSILESYMAIQQAKFRHSIHIHLNTSLNKSESVNTLVP